MRLAHEQGVLSRKSLNYFQHWALLYWVYMDRRTKMEDLRAELEQQTFNLFPERWMQLYHDDLLKALGETGEEEEIPVGIDDLEEMDRFMERMEGKYRMSGADAPKDFRAVSGEPMLQWGPWS